MTIVDVVLTSFLRGIIVARSGAFQATVLHHTKLPDFLLPLSYYNADTMISNKRRLFTLSFETTYYICVGSTEHNLLSSI